MVLRTNAHMLIRHNVGHGGYHGKTATPISKDVAEQLVENSYAVLDARLDLNGGGMSVTNYYRAVGNEPVFADDDRNVDRKIPSKRVREDFGVGDSVEVVFYDGQDEKYKEYVGNKGTVTEVRHYIRVDLHNGEHPTLFRANELEIVSKRELTKDDFKIGDRVEITQEFANMSDIDYQGWVGLAGTVLSKNYSYIRVDLDEKPGDDLFLPKEIKPSDKPKPVKDEVAKVLINGVEYTISGPGASKVQISTTTA